MGSDKKKHWMGWGIALVGSVLAASVPLLFIKYITGSFSPAILPQLENDHLYYLIQVQKVLQGHGSLGNPFILEYRDAVFPGLLLPIYLSAIPGFFGLSIVSTYQASAVVYSLLTAILLYILCKKLLANAPILGAIIAVLGMASVQNFILRPAIMQTVYPVFVLFILALLFVIDKPEHLKLYIPLGAITTLSFYLYPHLWMQTFTVIGLLLLLKLWQRNVKAVCNIVVMGIGIVILCLPQILKTITLFTDPMASLISMRTGLINTHIVLPLTFMNNKYTIATVVVLLLHRVKRLWSPQELMLMLLSASVLIAATSNIITGKVMDFHTHPWRLGIIVNIIAIPVLYTRFMSTKEFWLKVITGLFTAMLILSAVNRIVIRANAYSYIKRLDAITQQYQHRKEYERILSVLEEHNIHNSVILTDKHLSFIIPLYTNNTIVFVGRANLHVLPQAELLERFLVQNVNVINKAYLLNNVDHYGGINYIEQAKYNNAYEDDSEKIAPIDLLGGDGYLEEILKQWKEIDSNYEQYLTQFSVHYIIEDRLSEENVRIPRSAKVLYSDDRFTLYELSPAPQDLL